MMLTNKEQYLKQCSIDYRNRAKMKKCRAAVHIEDNNDRPFWAYVFQQYMPHDSFDFIPFTRMAQNKATGSALCLKYRDLGCLSKEFVIAIDSDEHYLLKEREMSATHYVLQTYAYSIENHYCNPLTINRAFRAKNKFNVAGFDFEKFLMTFSEKIYPFYIYYLYSGKKQDGKIRREDFIKSWDIAINNIDDNAAQYLDAVCSLVEVEMKAVESKYPGLDISSIEGEFRTLGVSPENTYLYIRGHNLFDKLITSILKTIYDRQVKAYLNSLSNEEKSKYANRSLNTEHEYFSQSLQYDYPEMMKIGEDIKSIFLTN